MFFNYTLHYSHNTYIDTLIEASEGHLANKWKHYRREVTGRLIRWTVASTAIIPALLYRNPSQPRRMSGPAMDAENCKEPQTYCKGNTFSE